MQHPLPVRGVHPLSAVSCRSVERKFVVLDLTCNQISGVKWEWLFGLLAIFTAACCVGVCFLLPETYGPLLLKKRAQQKRKETGDGRYYSQLEKRLQGQTKKQVARELMLSPIEMLFTEPVVLAACIYMAFMYGCLYLSFESFPFIYADWHQWNVGEVGLAFLPFPIGGFFGFVTTVLYYNPRYAKAVAKAWPENVAPEIRLPIAEHAALAYVPGFFITGVFLQYLCCSSSHVASLDCVSVANTSRAFVNFDVS